MNTGGPTPTAKKGRASGAPASNATLSRTSDSDARLAGAIAAARVELLGPFTPIDRSPCRGRCAEADITTLQHWGERHGCCPCLLEQGAPA